MKHNKIKKKANKNIVKSSQDGEGGVENEGAGSDLQPLIQTLSEQTLEGTLHSCFSQSHEYGI